jgi:hypothetical protein
MMRYTLTLCLAVAVTAAEIPKGAHVLLRMMNSINTRTAQEGDYVYLNTATPISVDGQIVAPVNSYVQGVVTRSRRSGRVSGRAELSIRLETITLPGGKVFKFSPHVAEVDSGESGQKVEARENTIKQGPDRGQDAKQIAILAVLERLSEGWRTGVGKALALARVSGAEWGSRRCCWAAVKRSTCGRAQRWMWRLIGQWYWNEMG